MPETEIIQKEEDIEKSLDVRRDFLIAFMKAVIQESAVLRESALPFDKEKILDKLLKLKSEIEMKHSLKDELDEMTEEESTDNGTKENISQERVQLKPKKEAPRASNKAAPRNFPSRLPFRIPPRQTYPTRNVSVYSNIPVRLGSAVPEQIIISSMNKLNTLLADPAVQMIECLGPEKQILVYKSGVIQNANITLKNEEINLLMKEISERTKIPLISGVFKTAIGNIIITAVISDFIGTRFMMQRKSDAPV